ncbi:hypothetical protein ACWGCW_18270 [Streptomyces sp. NPDC054933]
MTEAVNQVPGAPVVKGVVDGVLDTVGAVSPHARRVAAYAGVGLLGVVGLVEWPVAAAGAAVVWLTQSRPEHNGHTAAQQAGQRPRARKAQADRPTTKSAAERPAAKKSAPKKTTSKRTAAKKTAARKTARTATAARSRTSAQRGASQRARTSPSATSGQKA